MTVRNIVTRGLRYAKNGPPSAVLQKEEWLQPFSKASKDVVVKMVAAPVHHHDKWLIKGCAGQLKARGTPSVGGTEGTGVVEEVGEQVTHFKPGDKVVLNRQDIGTWADVVVADEAALDKVPGDLQPEDLAMMSVYGTAWRIVNDYGKIKPDDVVWVLGGGAVGTAVACLLQQKGAITYLIVRGGRPNEHEFHRVFRRHLPTCATVKTTALMRKVMNTITSDVPRPKLIVNGMGGDALRESLRFAADGCKVVSYGNMSQKPLSVSLGRHMYRDIELLTFWYGRYLARSSREDREAMYEEIAKMMRTGAHGNTYGSEWQMMSRLFVRAERYEFEKYHQQALMNASLLFAHRKPILRFDEEYTWTHSGEWHKEAEYFHTKETQFGKNISTAMDERHQNEFKSVEAGGPVLQKEFNELWDSAEASEVRKGMKSFDMQEDHWELMEDTYARYLETQAAKYNLDISAGRPNKNPTRVSGATACFYPDDDPRVKETLAF